MATRMATDSPWSKPVNLGPPVNTRHWEGGLALFESDDGLSLFFTSDRPGGQGGSDIWLTTRSTPGGPWANPVNLGSPLNSPAADWGPSISSNGLELYFSSDRPNGHGGDDIYVTTRAPKTMVHPACQPMADCCFSNHLERGHSWEVISGSPNGQPSRTIGGHP
jgi:hypothetical protein